jgi:hypothetical protein
MITIFCVFCQFLAKKICHFLKKQCYDQFFAKSSSSLRKKAKNVGKNTLKIIASVPEAIF